MIGWDDNEHVDEDKFQYCHYCKKLYINNDAFVGHLLGKKHIKMEEQGVEEDPEEQERARNQYRE